MIMMREKLVASDFLAKDVLNLESGDLIGVVTGVLVAEDPLQVTALALFNETAVNTEERLTFCDYGMVTDVDQEVVVISSFAGDVPTNGKNLIGLSCVDCNGKLVGRVVDCVWQSIDGVVVDVIVEQDYLQAVVHTNSISKIGNGALVLNLAETQLEKQVGSVGSHHENKREEDADELLHGLIRRMGTTLSEAGQRVGERVKHIDTDEINREVNRFTERVGKELRYVIETISEQTKATKNATVESEVISVMRDLEYFTVSEAIYDCNGDLIMMPGQLVSEAVVRRIIENDKIAELYRVAVSVKNGEENE